MFKLIVSDHALQDLDSIGTYITVQLANPIAAANFFDEVEACYTFLMRNPMMYEKCRDDRLAAEGYRKAVIKNYVAIYRVSEETETVFIARFFNSAQDYTKLL